MTITDVVNRFNTTPFLFVGSGMTRRYLGLPDWKGLLEHFALEIKDDPFSYSAYESRAKMQPCPAGVLPKVAELIQKDYDEKWFAHEVQRTVGEDIQRQIISGVSPFKVEMAAFIKNRGTINESYQDEIKKLVEISSKSITGVITTNYDTFLEDYFSGFKKYIGQGQLIFSAIQGVAEIYKIHGSVEEPGSLVINESDYLEFEAKSAYLASKLMTIFMEYPIVFAGYSIGDTNIQKILKSIAECLDTTQLERLKDRFVFVEYNSNLLKEEVTPYTIMIDGKPISMTKIVLKDFLPLYSAIGKKKAKFPVRILRRFKEELYSFVITNTPTETMRVASIEDQRVIDEDMVLAIGRADQLGIRGLSGIKGNEWYRDIMLGDLPFTADELLEYAYPKLLKDNSNRLPVNKYLICANKPHPQCEKDAAQWSLDTIIPPSIRKKRGSIIYHSIAEIWSAEGSQYNNSKIIKAATLISQLHKKEFDVGELETVLMKLFDDKDILEHVNTLARSNVKRLIRIYDYLKWGKGKELPD